MFFNPSDQPGQRLGPSAVTGLLAEMQRRGIESRFVFFPDENHWILKPANSLQWHREVLDWLNKHLN